MKNRYHKLAEHLAAWAVSDDRCDVMKEFVACFLGENKDDIKKLSAVEKQLDELDEQKGELSKTIVSSFYKFFNEVEKAEHLTASDDHLVFNDVAFWACLKTADEKAYSLLQPRWEELEKRAISQKLKEKSRQSAERRQRLIAESKEQSTGEQDGKEKNNEESGNEEASS